MSDIPVIDLSKAPGERAAWDQPTWKIYAWAICELLFVTNAWQISSGLRIRVLRMFGAEIGHGVVFRPRTRVKFPWKLHVGDRSWIGEGVWFDNQGRVYLGNDVSVPQVTMLPTGVHAQRTDMALRASTNRTCLPRRCANLSASTTCWRPLFTAMLSVWTTTTSSSADPRVLRPAGMSVWTAE